MAYFNQCVWSHSLSGPAFSTELDALSCRNALLLLLQLLTTVQGSDGQISNRKYLTLKS